MEPTGLDSTYRVDKFAWLIVLGSAVAALVIAGLIAFFTVTTYRNLYLSRMRDDLSARRYAQAQDSLAPLFQGAPILGGLGRQNEPILQAGKQAASTLIETLSSLSPATIHAAVGRLGAVKRDLSLVSDFPAEPILRIGKLEERAAAIAREDDLLEADLRSKASMGAQLADARTQYDLLAKDTSELFGLPSVSSAPGAAPAFYTSGILAGVPALTGLSDGIESLDDLKAKLLSAGGGVHLEGENVHELFDSKLSTLKQDGSALSSRFAAQNSALALLENRLQTASEHLQKELNSFANELQAAIDALVAALTR